MKNITVIYFNNENKSIYADLPPNEEIVKRLSKRIYRNAMTALATEHQKKLTLLQTIYAVNVTST